MFGFFLCIFFRYRENANVSSKFLRHIHCVRCSFSRVSAGDAEIDFRGRFIFPDLQRRAAAVPAVRREVFFPERVFFREAHSFQNAVAFTHAIPEIRLKYSMVPRACAPLSSPSENFTGANSTADSRSAETQTDNAHAGVRVFF